MGRIKNAIYDIEEKIHLIEISIKELDEEPQDSFTDQLRDELEREKLFYCNELYSLTDGNY